jgi:hypothetical protein
MSETLNDPSEKLEGMNTYIEGKMKRYSLLFAVNGGAFAIAKVFGERDGAQLLGGLTLQHLALGAVAFTVLMGVDIFLFGLLMRRKFFGDRMVFTWAGRIILVALCVLVIAGWLIAAFGHQRPGPANKTALMPPNTALPPLRPSPNSNQPC